MRKAQYLEDMVKSVLERNEFRVITPYEATNALNTDILATRSGLTLLIECAIESPVTMDDLAKINNVGMFLSKTQKPLALKKILVTTTMTEVPDFISKLADDHNILIIKVDLELGEEDLRKKLGEYVFLKPTRQFTLSPFEMVELELQRREGGKYIELWNKIINWYKEGGKDKISREIQREISEIKRKWG